MCWPIYILFVCSFGADVFGFGCEKGTGDGFNLEMLVLVVVEGDMGGLGVFTDHHVNANFRTVNLMCFFFKVAYFIKSVNSYS